MNEYIKNILANIKIICKKYKSIEKVFLHGSRAKGNYTERSDIDIAIYSVGIDIEEIKDEFDNIDTLLKIDVVDMTNCKNELLIQEINKYGILIYNKIPEI